MKPKKKAPKRKAGKKSGKQRSTIRESLEEMRRLLVESERDVTRLRIRCVDLEHTALRLQGRRDEIAARESEKSDSLWRALVALRAVSLDVATAAETEGMPVDELHERLALVRASVVAYDNTPG